MATLRILTLTPTGWWTSSSLFHHRTIEHIHEKAEPYNAKQIDYTLKLFFTCHGLLLRFSTCFFAPSFWVWIILVMCSRVFDRCYNPSIACCTRFHWTPMSPRVYCGAPTRGNISTCTGKMASNTNTWKELDACVAGFFYLRDARWMSAVHWYWTVSLQTTAIATGTQPTGLHPHIRTLEMLTLMGRQLRPSLGSMWLDHCTKTLKRCQDSGTWDRWTWGVVIEHDQRRFKTSGVTQFNRVTHLVVSLLCTV